MVSCVLLWPESKELRVVFQHFWVVFNLPFLIVWSDRSTNRFWGCSRSWIDLNLFEGLTVEEAVNFYVCFSLVIRASPGACRPSEQLMWTFVTDLMLTKFRFKSTRFLLSAVPNALA